MAKLSSYRLLYKTDFPQQYQSLVDQMSLTINQSFQEVYSAFNNNITFADNINATIVTINVSVDKTGTPQTAVNFKLNTFQTVLQGLIVLNTVCTNNSLIYPTAGLFLSFTSAKGTVSINNIQGLPKDDKWAITLLAI